LGAAVRARLSTYCLQFLVLKAAFPEVFNPAAQGEAQAHNDPRTATAHARVGVEAAMVDWLYRREKTLERTYQNNLAAYLAKPTFQVLVGETLSIKARFVKIVGNASAHGKPISFMQARR
jgi:type I restriction enzyme, R subunit